ncbi:aminotransferase class IV [Flavihumibacter solisilvae]|uniref:branched-chain-amino-acid transaminase n=1 Tax=Flavihumibacter solisilvae TaxID=1349421 RepID=A0A0C1LCL0_9BACT|nr:aminotransferase class IV [Flavihumibacter solisilvae]KIC93248.1 hypothetical protein OI18_18525 [Flavihumibacter solisilvae]
MSHLLFHDGQYYRDDKLLAGAGSRGLRYGDGLFETMKVNNDSIQLGAFHMDRLFAGLELLEFDLPHYFTADYVLDRILQLAHRNGHAKLSRVRLMVFRGNGGLYDPESNFPHHVIQTQPLPEANHRWTEHGLTIGIHRKAIKSMDALANCKTNNYLVYVMAALEARHMKWNDALVLNHAGRICDASIANLFIVSGDNIITPSLAEGPVAGTMRRYLVDELKKQGRAVKEQEVTEEMLFAADEIFLTNASYGLRWVARAGEKKMSSNFTREIYESLIRPLF